MGHKEELGVIRKQLDELDAQLITLFEKRMKLSEEVAEIKKRGNLALTDEGREGQVVERAVSLGDPQLKGEITLFMKSLMALSKLRQRQLLLEKSEVQLLPTPRKPLEGEFKIAYQGSPGAWGERATINLFQDKERIALESFEGVFEAVKNKSAAYGVVPIENSQSGAIGEVYDLLRKYGCYIVGQTWVKVDHCLIGVKGAKLEDIREVLSHEEGFKQCRNYLKGKAWDLTACSNTAIAAATVAKKGEKRLAAIGSKRAAEVNDLEILAEGISSQSSNKTRFISIADTPEYDDSSNIVSVILRTGHYSGALVDVLFPLMAQGVNMTRIESRPMSLGQYCFFTDLEGNISNPAVSEAIKQAAASTGFVEVLGCYKEK
ncbi:MAG: bifunctional chorismate mutase/prephenate dehydratase [Anaerovoracaceae bacterium]|jgi:chorismate mutase/prephenate dehydratase